eukprot:6209360-Pleurochrysis_carterae.AAC.3
MRSRCLHGSTSARRASACLDEQVFVCSHVLLHAFAFAPTNQLVCLRACTQPLTWRCKRGVRVRDRSPK